MKEFLIRLFSDESGNPSSNRVIGALVVVVGLILACVGQNSTALTVLSTGTALLGVGQIKSAAILASQSSAKAKADPGEASEKK